MYNARVWYEWNRSGKADEQFLATTELVVTANDYIFRKENQTIVTYNRRHVRKIETELRDA